MMTLTYSRSLPSSRLKSLQNPLRMMLISIVCPSKCFNKYFYFLLGNWKQSISKILERQENTIMVYFIVANLWIMCLIIIVNISLVFCRCLSLSIRLERKTGSVPFCNQNSQVRSKNFQLSGHRRRVNFLPGVSDL